MKKRKNRVWLVWSACLRKSGKKSKVELTQKKIFEISVDTFQEKCGTKSEKKHLKMENVTTYPLKAV